MSNQLLSSKIIAIEEAPTARGIPTLPSAVVGAVGTAERGPINRAVLCSSLQEYHQVFGGFTPDATLPLAALGYYQNGGASLWCVRVAHYKDIANPSTLTATSAHGSIKGQAGPGPATLQGNRLGPFPFLPGDKLSLSVNGIERDVILGATPAALTSTSTGNLNLAEGQTLVVQVDAGREQSITFKAADFADITKAKPAEVAATLNANLIGASAVVASGAVTLRSDSRGRASRIAVLGGTATAFAFPASPAVGGGNVADVEAVTSMELCEMFTVLPDVLASVSPKGMLTLQTKQLGKAAILQAKAQLLEVLGVDGKARTGTDATPAEVLRVEARDLGSYGNRIEVEVKSNHVTGLFDLLITYDGQTEPLLGLSLDPASSRYVERIVNDEKHGSKFMRVIDPRRTDFTPPPPQRGKLSLGDDGLTGLIDADFAGSSVSKTGLHALNPVQDLSLVIVPGRASPALHDAITQYIEVERNGKIFGIYDPLENMSAIEVVDYVTKTAKLKNSTELAALYWPWLKVSNPAPAVFGPSADIIVPPSGYVAGVYARVDSARPGGIYDYPAGSEAGKLFGVLGLEHDEPREERKRDLVYPHRINPITTEPGAPIFIDGSRTLHDSGRFPYIAERRGILHIERSLIQGLRYVKHRANNEALRAELQRTITSFLTAQMRLGAFASTDPSKAFFVDVGDAVNPASALMRGELSALIGVATAKPAEFVILRIQSMIAKEGNQ